MKQSDKSVKQVYNEMVAEYNHDPLFDDKDETEMCRATLTAVSYNRLERVASQGPVDLSDDPHEIELEQRMAEEGYFRGPVGDDYIYRYKEE